MTKWGSKPIEEVLQSAAAKITLLELENQRLRAALEWYADEHHWQAIHAIEQATLAVVDAGERAREALERGEG